MFLYPAVLCAQQDWNKSSPLEYMWQNVGNAGFSSDTAWWTKLVISPSGEPYVSFWDFVHTRKATVMKYNGTNWVYVGNALFTPDSVAYVSRLMRILEIPGKRQ